jgi:hypothetical protein
VLGRGLHEIHEIGCSHVPVMEFRDQHAPGFAYLARELVAAAVLKLGSNAAARRAELVLRLVVGTLVVAGRTVVVRIGRTAGVRAKCDRASRERAPVRRTRCSQPEQNAARKARRGEARRPSHPPGIAATANCATIAPRRRTRVNTGVRRTPRRSGTPRAPRLRRVEATQTSFPFDGCARITWVQIPGCISVALEFQRERDVTCSQELLHSRYLVA